MSKPLARLVVAFDGSPPASRALAFALTAADRVGGKVAIVHATDRFVPASLALGAAEGSLTWMREGFVAGLDTYARELLDAATDHRRGKALGSRPGCSMPRKFMMRMRSVIGGGEHGLVSGLFFRSTLQTATRQSNVPAKSHAGTA